MIKFLPLEILGFSIEFYVSLIKNAIYRLQISALVPEIFKFEKCVKYTDEMTYDILYSTQFIYIKYINSAILVNFATETIQTWQGNSSQHTYSCKNYIPIATRSCPVPSNPISTFKWFWAWKTLNKAIHSS